MQGSVGRGLLGTVVALGLITIANYALPLVTVPYLTRTLGAAKWGGLAFAQSFGQYAALVLEFGFGLSASREIARHRSNKMRCSETLSGVFGAKLLLSSALWLIAAGAYVFVQEFHSNPVLLIVSMIWAFSQGMNMMWFFLGLDRAKWFAKVDVSAKALGAISIFILVRQPEDGWKVLAIQAVAAMAATGYGMRAAHKEFAFQRPRWPAVRSALRLSSHLFLQRASASLYTVGNAFILGLFVSPVYVAYYAGAERIVRASLGMLGPINQALYPRMSHLAFHDEVDALRIGRRVVILLSLVGAAMSLVLVGAAPWIIEIALGPEFKSALVTLRILSLLPIFVAVSSAFGTQLMLPLGMEKQSSMIIMAGGIFNLATSLIVAPRFQHVGMACTVTAAEAIVSLAMAVYVLKRARVIRRDSGILILAPGSGLSGKVILKEKV